MDDRQREVERVQRIKEMQEQKKLFLVEAQRELELANRETKETE